MEQPTYLASQHSRIGTAGMCTISRQLENGNRLIVLWPPCT